MSVPSHRPTMVTLETCFGPTTLTVLESGSIRTRWEMEYPGVTKRSYSVQVDIAEHAHTWLSSAPQTEQVIRTGDLKIKYSEQPDREFHTPKGQGWSYNRKPDVWKETVARINAELRPDILGWKQNNPVTYYSELAAYAQVRVDEARVRVKSAQDKLAGAERKAADYYAQARGKEVAV